MHESTHQEQRRLTNQSLTKQAEGARKSRAIDDRCAAVRRWIDEDDDSACRGID